MWNVLVHFLFCYQTPTYAHAYATLLPTSTIISVSQMLAALWSLLTQLEEKNRKESTISLFFNVCIFLQFKCELPHDALISLKYTSGMVHHMAWNNFNYSLKRRFYQDKQHAMMHNNDHNGVALHIYKILFHRINLQYQGSNTSDKIMYIYLLCSEYINSHPTSKYMQIVFRIHLCAKPTYFVWHTPIFHREEIHMESHISITFGFCTISVVQITKKTMYRIHKLESKCWFGYGVF